MQGLEEVLEYVDAITKNLVDKRSLLRAEEEQYKILAEFIDANV